MRPLAWFNQINQNQKAMKNEENRGQLPKVVIRTKLPEILYEDRPQVYVVLTEDDDADRLMQYLQQSLADFPNKHDDPATQKTVCEIKTLTIDKSLNEKYVRNHDGKIFSLDRIPWKHTTISIMATFKEYTDPMYQNVVADKLKEHLEQALRTLQIYERMKNAKQS